MHTPRVEFCIDSASAATVCMVCMLGLGRKDCSMQSLEKSRKTHTDAITKYERVRAPRDAANAMAKRIEALIEMEI